MKETKKITLGTVIATSVGAVLFVILSLVFAEKLAKTTVLAMMIFFAVSWSLEAIILIVRYLKQRKVDK